MHAKQISCVFLAAVLLMLFAAQATAQSKWTVTMQDAKTGAWTAPVHSSEYARAADIAAYKSCLVAANGAINANGMRMYSAAKVVGPGTEKVTPCDVVLSNFASPSQAPKANSSTAPPPAATVAKPSSQKSGLPSLDTLIRNPKQTLKKLAGGWFKKSKPTEKAEPAPAEISAPIVTSTVSAPSSTPAPARSGDAVLMSYYLVMLNALRDRPELLSEETWNKLTAIQISAAQKMYSQGAFPEMEAVFTAEQVKDRNPELAAAELAPALKADLAARANAAPDELVARHPLHGLHYDDSTGKLVTKCCFGRPRVRPGWFDLLRPAINAVNGFPTNEPAAYQPSSRLPQRARSMAVYEVKENLGMQESGPVTALATFILTGERFEFRPDGMTIALDRWVEIDGIPMTRADAEKLLDAIRPPRKLVETRVTFTATGADKGSDRAVLYGKLVSASIVGPSGETVATFPAEAFPKVSDGP